MGVEKAWTLSNTGAEACPSSQGVGSEAHEKEREAGWGQASLLLSAGYSSWPLHSRNFLLLLLEPWAWPALVWSEELSLPGPAT